MFIRARLRNVCLHALALSLVAGGFLPSSALALDVTEDLPSLSFPSRHDADSASQTIRMTSASETDSAITSITAVAPNSFAPSAVDAKASCSNPIYASLCQELKNNMGSSTPPPPTTPTGWQTIYSGSGTTSLAVSGSFSSFRGTIAFKDYYGTSYTRTISGTNGGSASASVSDTKSTGCTVSASIALPIPVSGGFSFNGTTSVSSKSCTYYHGTSITNTARAQIQGARITSFEVYR